MVQYATVDELFDSLHDRKLTLWERVWLFGINQYVKNAYWWVKHRTVSRYNVVKLRSLKPGYYEVDTRLFAAMFDLLVEHVEEELTWMGFICSNRPKQLKWWQSKRKYVRAHKAELMNEHFTWCESLGVEDERQRNEAFEVHALYNWYKHERPKRVDWWWEHRKTNPDALNESTAMETEQFNQDTEMMVRLIKVRIGLWT